MTKEDWQRRREQSVSNTASRVSLWNRRRKWALFEREMRPNVGMRVLDIGYSEVEHQNADNFIEKYYPYPENLTALGVDEPKQFHVRYPQVKVVQYDGVIFPFEDNAFDVVWSNAVIEHVGDRDRQLQFIREIKRVSTRAFITTPNRHFPLEIHTRTPLLHFLPLSMFEAYLRVIGKGWATEDYMRLLSSRDLRKLLSEAEIASWRIVKNRLGVFTLDFVVLIDAC
jgi:SAM-dependent methyltransferase